MNEMDERTARIQSLMGLIRVLYQKKFPDSANITIKIRGRMFLRMEVVPVIDEKVIEQRNITIRT